MTNKSDIKIRQMTVADIPEVLTLQEKTFPAMPPWKVEDMIHHIELFPEGQLVAIDADGKIAGSCSALIIDWDDYSESAHWSVITGHGTFNTHNPLGKTLYGADMSVDPDLRRLGIGTLFYDARKKIVKDKGLKRMLTGGRIPGYAEYSHRMSPKQYVKLVIQGRLKDPTLNFQLKNGFVVLDVVPEYLLDKESRGFATLLEWLNPEYMMTQSLIESEERKDLGEIGKEKIKELIGLRRIRVAAVQYMLKPISSFEGFAKQVEFFIRSAKEYNSQFVLFPELFTMQLLSYLKESSPGRSTRILAQLTKDYNALFKKLATEHNLYIIGGTHPIIEQGQLYNTAHFFTPSGKVFFQKKVHLTPTEKNQYQISRGHGFYVFDTEYGKIAILVCYDVEFPEAARVLAEAGAEILFVPSCTDERQAFLRVRYCAQARAIENQIYVVMACTVGNLPEVPGMATNYGQAGIFTPCDYFFARDGIAAEGIVNQDQMILADLDLDLLDEQRVNGTVIPLNDLIKDAYDQVIQHKVDAP